MRFPFPGFALATCLLTMALPCRASEPISIPHESFTLPNGLQVILHEDHSDPLVAVYVYYHVGSGREEPGRSGFAHLFEHVMFQGSENVGDDQHFKLIQEAGGTLNGSTTADRTNYYEVLPSNQLELALWLESDRMGYLLPAVTQENLDNQREVVKNERRQNYENRPYAQAREEIARLLYPEDHPYSWITIGSMADLTAASLEDVHAFFRQWYGPNNATLAIGGDIDPATTRELVERYFGPIPRGPAIPDPTPRPTVLPATKRGAMEDRVKLPQLTVTWPTVHDGHADGPALDLLAQVLSANDSAVLDKALRIDEPLASRVSAWHWEQELAGTMTVTLRPQPGVSLDTLERRLHELLAELARAGVDDERLRRLKTAYRAGVIRRLETVSGRTSRLCRDSVFTGDPSHVTTDLADHDAVTAADVLRVLHRYVLNRPAVVFSVVPRGQLDQAASGEGIPTPVALDRTQQPPGGPVPAFRPLPVWHGELTNGVKVVGTAFDEVPLTRFTLSVPAGRIHETLDTLGLASFTAAMLQEGTAELTGPEFQDTLDGLGASASVSADDDEITFSVSTLNENLPAVVGLLADVILEPRFDAADFERLRRDRLTSLETRSDQIRAIAGDAWDRLSYGRDDVRGWPSLGTAETLERLTVDDVRQFWRDHGASSGARMTWVGERDAREVRQLFRSLTSRWRGRTDTAAVASTFREELPLPERTRIYLVDKPGAPQSEIRIGHAGVAATHPDWYRITLMNHPLGGSFSSRINLNLREDKGWTYGARSGFSGGVRQGTFTASAGIRTNVTADAVREFVREIEGILSGPTAEELAFTRDALLQAMGRQFESTMARGRVLDAIGRLGRPDDYLMQRRQLISTITAAELRGLARTHLHPDRLTILVVGDAETVREPLEELGYGPVIELDPTGSPVADSSTSASF